MTIYLGEAVRRERIASARPNGYGYKAVIIHRTHAPGERIFDRTQTISRTLKTRDEAIAVAQRRIDANR